MVYELNVIIEIITMDINKDSAGVIYDIIKFIISVGSKFLLNNLSASLMGWRIPNIPTLLGPFRIWIYPKIFRSRIV